MTSTSTDRRFGVNSGMAIKVPCKASSTSNITLSGEQTIDGVSCVTGDRVLVNGQTDGTENGIYIVDTGAWSRAADFDGSYDAIEGTLVPVNSGTSNGGYIWRLTTTDPTIGTDSLSFSVAFSSASISAFILTLLDDANAAAARTTLGALSSANNAVAFANLQDIATQRVIGRNTAGTGDPEEVTLSQLLDWIGSAAQGDILYRDASGWARLGAGTSGYFLKTLGAGANPAWASVAGITVGTAVASTSGTAIDFTGLPSTVKRITIMISGVSTNGTSTLIAQIGDSGGVETSGYLSRGAAITSTPAATDAGEFTTGFYLAGFGAAADTATGALVIENIDGQTWVAHGATYRKSSGTSSTNYCAGNKTLSPGSLDRVRITTTGGDTFDAGTINIFYE